MAAAQNSQPLIGKKLAKLQKNQRVAGELERYILDAIARRKPDIVALDPFIKLHDLVENDSTDMNFVCGLLTRLAVENDIAVDVPHQFADWHEPELTEPWQRAGVCRATYYNRRRLRRAVAAAFELGRRRRHVMPPPPARACGANAPPGQKDVNEINGDESGFGANAPPRADANELEALAARVARLTVSHRSPEKFFEDKSELVYELRALAARASQGGTACRR